MYHSFLIHSSADGHLGCFHVLAMKKFNAKFHPMKLFIHQTLINKIMKNSYEAVHIVLTGEWLNARYKEDDKMLLLSLS